MADLRDGGAVRPVDEAVTLDDLPSCRRPFIGAMERLGQPFPERSD